MPKSDATQFVTEARNLLRRANECAIKRNPGETVEYPRVVGDRIEPAVGVIEMMRCTNPDARLVDRIIMFQIRGLDGKTDVLQCGAGFRVPTVG